MEADRRPPSRLVHDAIHGQRGLSRVLHGPISLETEPGMIHLSLRAFFVVFFIRSHLKHSCICYVYYNIYYMIFAIPKSFIRIASVASVVGEESVAGRCPFITTNGTKQHSGIGHNYKGHCVLAQTWDCAIALWE